MNRLLDSRYDELVHRLVWGIELHDAVRRVPTTGATIRLEPATPLLPRLDDHGTGRFSLTFRRGLPTTLRWLVHSPPQRFVPRRFAVDLATEAALDAAPFDDPDVRLLRTGRRIALFPAAAYPTPAGATTIRGRALRGGAPLRWARIEVRIPSLSAGLLARAHTDARGDYHAVIGPIPGAFVVPATAEVELTVSGPDPVGDRDALDPHHRDPLWDLPLEALPVSGVAGTVPTDTMPTDAIASGTDLPVTYRASAGGPLTHPIRTGRVTALPAATFS